MQSHFKPLQVAELRQLSVRFPGPSEAQGFGSGLEALGAAESLPSTQAFSIVHKAPEQRRAVKHLGGRAFRKHDVAVMFHDVLTNEGNKLRVSLRAPPGELRNISVATLPRNISDVLAWAPLVKQWELAAEDLLWRQSLNH